MKFELGKYYVHSTGLCIHIIGALESTIYGWTFISERPGVGSFQPVGSDADAAVNWEETTKEHFLFKLNVN